MNPLNEQQLSVLKEIYQYQGNAIAYEANNCHILTDDNSIEVTMLEPKFFVADIEDLLSRGFLTYSPQKTVIFPTRFSNQIGAWLNGC